MKEWVVPHLRCLGCRGALTLTAIERSGAGETTTGVLRCACGSWYPVIRGIPRLVAPSLRVRLTEDFAARHHEALQDLAIDTAVGAGGGDRHLRLTARTMTAFGFEWTEYARFGWDDPDYDLARERAVFHRKSMFSADDLAGRLVLDAGCGNGRYAYWAAASAAQVVAVDVSDAVEAAAQNTATLENVQIVQADLCHLPFARDTFDAAFAIGVLMHTGNPRRALGGLAGVTKPGGHVSVHLYGRGNVFYEAVNGLTRAVTTRLSIPSLRRFTAGAFLLRGWLLKTRLGPPVLRIVRIDSHPHCIFDWYAAPSATHHTYPQVAKWFRDCELELVASHERDATAFERIRRIFWGGPTNVTMRARRASMPKTR